MELERMTGDDDTPEREVSAAAERHTPPDSADAPAVEWTPYPLSVEDVALVINMIVAGTVRGAFSLDEYEVIMPLHRRLVEHAKAHPDIFELVRQEVVAAEGGHAAGTAALKAAPGVGTSRRRAYRKRR